MAAREVNIKKETPVMALSRASAGSQPEAPPAICVPTVTDCYKRGLDLTAITPMKHEVVVVIKCSRESESFSLTHN